MTRRNFIRATLGAACVPLVAMAVEPSREAIRWYAHDKAVGGSPTRLIARSPLNRTTRLQFAEQTTAIGSRTADAA